MVQFLVPVVIKEIEYEEGLSDKIDTTRMKKPSFLMVLTANGPYAYRREDGIYVVPISCLNWRNIVSMKYQSYVIKTD